MGGNKIVVSFSGGETSAFMAWYVKEKYSATHEILYIFANTGDENEETLIFADKCDKHFGLNLVWVEAVTNPQYGDGVSAKIVNFETASRNAEPFKAMVSKYGIPNPSFKHCSRELKANVIRAYLRSIKWKKREYKIAIGIRQDELDRIKKEWYPLCETQERIDKPFINRFWQKMPFRLNLKGYQGNCKVCWKKTLRKLLTIAKETPEAFEHFEEMEHEFEYFTPESRQHNKNIKPPHRFYREYLSVADILELSKQPFEPAVDDSQIFHSYTQTELFGHELDKTNGCIESCEPF